MKKTTLLLLALILSFGLNAQEKEKSAIKELITKAYVNGLHNLGPRIEIEKGFHPGFNLLIMNPNNNLDKLPIYNWLNSYDQRKAQNPDGPAIKTEARFPMIDITGTAAVAKVELYREGNLIFTDYLSLYQFEEGWRIVGKVYYKH